MIHTSICSLIIFTKKNYNLFDLRFIVFILQHPGDNFGIEALADALPDDLILSTAKIIIIHLN